MARKHSEGKMGDSLISENYLEIAMMSFGSQFARLYRIGKSINPAYKIFKCFEIYIHISPMLKDTMFGKILEMMLYAQNVGLGIDRADIDYNAIPGTKHPAIKTAIITAKMQGVPLWGTMFWYIDGFKPNESPDIIARDIYVCIDRDNVVGLSMRAGEIDVHRLARGIALTCDTRVVICEHKDNDEISLAHVYECRGLSRIIDLEVKI